MTTVKPPVDPSVLLATELADHGDAGSAGSSLVPQLSVGTIQGLRGGDNVVHALREDRPGEFPRLAGDVTRSRYAFIFRRILSLRTSATPAGKASAIKGATP